MGGRGIGAGSNEMWANEISAGLCRDVEFSSVDDESSAVVVLGLHFALKALVGRAGFYACCGLKNSGCGDVARLLDPI